MSAPVTNERSASAARGCMRAGISSEKSSRSSSGIDRRVRQAGAAGGLEPRLATALGKLAHLENIGLPLGDGNHAAGIEHVERMGGLENLVIGGKGQLMASMLLAALQEVTA